MSLIAIWFSEGRRAQDRPVPRYPLPICRWRVLGRQYGAAALQGLLADIRDGRIDILVIYRVDWLTQSLAQHCAAVEIFDARDAAFVPLRSSAIRRARCGSPHAQFSPLLD